MWEQNYYRGGDDDGVVRCQTLAPVGLACGWEWAPVPAPRAASPGVSSCSWAACAGRHTRSTGGGRSRPGPARARPATPVRPGTAPPGGPPRRRPRGDRPPRRRHCLRDPARSRDPLENLHGRRDPDLRARRHHSRPPRLRRRRRSHRRHDHLDQPEPVDPIDNHFWIPNQTVSLRILWHAMNGHGAAKYHAMRLLRRRLATPPRRQPPDEVAPSAAPETRSATTPADHGDVELGEVSESRNADRALGYRLFDPGRRRHGHGVRRRDPHRGRPRAHRHGRTGTPSRAAMERRTAHRFVRLHPARGVLRPRLHAPFGPGGYRSSAAEIVA